MIIQQNDLACKENVKLKIKRKIKGNKKNGIIIMETDPVTHKLLVEKLQIKLRWNRCRVFDYVSVLRCYKCCGYHHFAKDCKSEVNCAKCAEKHSEKECKSVLKKFVNCTRMVQEYELEGIKTDHYANDPSCECYKRLVGRAQKNISYYND